MKEGGGLEGVQDSLPHAVLLSAHSKASHSRSLLELELHQPESKERKCQSLEPASIPKVCVATELSGPRHLLLRLRTCVQSPESTWWKETTHS